MDEQHKDENPQGENAVGSTSKEALPVAEPPTHVMQGVASIDENPLKLQASPRVRNSLGGFAWMCIGILVGLCLGIAIPWVIQSNEPKDDAGIFIAKGTIIISIEDLHRAFDKDVPSAERMYKNMPLLVTGKVKNINTTSGTKTASIGLETGGMVPAVARFDKQNDKINKLKVGQIIALKCQFDTFGKLSVTEFLEHKSGNKKITGITGAVLNWLPDVPFVEIVQLKKCELIQWEY